MLKEIISDAENKFKATLEHLQGELAVVRSSQTSPSLVEDVAIPAYDSTFPLKELAAISIPEPNMILIQPWDQSIIQHIEEGLNSSGIGISPVVDGSNIRLVIPPLSEERRQEYAKRVGQLCEDSRVAVRNIRQEKMKSIDGLEDESKISEDERDWARDEIQKLVDNYNDKISELKDKKVDSILTM